MDKTELYKLILGTGGKDDIEYCEFCKTRLEVCEEKHPYGSTYAIETYYYCSICD